MKYLLIIFSILLLVSNSLSAQNNTCYLIGQILDAYSNEPIPNVSISVIDQNGLHTTNSKGEFTIQVLCGKINTILVTHIGYNDTLINSNFDKKEHLIWHLNRSALTLDEVTVLAKKKSVSGSESISQISIKKSSIEQFPTQSLAHLVADQQGISIVSAGANIQRPIIHGLYGNRILIINNGLKHGFQNWGGDHAQEIDLNAANHITVLKGASGVRFGPEALGGAILIEPNPLVLNNRMFTKIGTSFETNGWGLNTSIHHGEGFRKWSYAINGKLTKIGDRHAPNYQLTNTGKEEQSFGFGTRFNSGIYRVKQIV